MLIQEKKKALKRDLEIIESALRENIGMDVWCGLVCMIG